MSHILKYHQADSLQDSVGNPLAHLSQCFIRCTVKSAEASLSAEEGACYGSGG